MSSKLIVLAAIDLNPGSSLVFERAVTLASSHAEGEVHVVTVSEPQVPLMVYPGFAPPPELKGIDAEEVAQFCRDRLQGFHDVNPSARLPHVHVHTTVGRPADEIVWLAAHLDADFVVVSTHGHRGLKRLLVGSVAEKVMRLAGCPVIVVRDKNHRADWRIPEIEPLCPECAAMRQKSAGAQLWCTRHLERHVRGHVLAYSNPADGLPHAWAGITGVR